MFMATMRMDTMLRQLRHATTDVRIDNNAIWLGDAKPDLRRLEAADIMLELTEGRPLDFSTTVKTPELLHFTLEGSSLRLFTSRLACSLLSAFRRIIPSRRCSRERTLL